jgi:uncharacterized protein YutE (UPF0331/DUF86 family)
LRNLNVHEYYRIGEGELLEMVELLEGVSDFVQKVKKTKNKSIKFFRPVW